MKHEHTECIHDLCHCGHCDVVWCRKCNKEWGGAQYAWPPWHGCYTGTPKWIVSGGTVVAHTDEYDLIRVPLHDHST